MSRNTRSCAASVALALVLAGGPASGVAPHAGSATSSSAALAAPALPPRVVAEAPGLAVQGGGEMTFFGLSVYDGWYWSAERGVSFARPFALDLTYRRHFDGRRIAERSLDEMAKLGYGTAEDHLRWREEMARIFPSVAKGDRLTGLYVPGGVVRYFHNGSPIGEIADPGFARAFFGIWLDPRTSRGDFRRKLLGEAP